MMYLNKAEKKHLLRLLNKHTAFVVHQINYYKSIKGLKANNWFDEDAHITRKEIEHETNFNCLVLLETQFYENYPEEFTPKKNIK